LIVQYFLVKDYNTYFFTSYKLVKENRNKINYNELNNSHKVNLFDITLFVFCYPYAPLELMKIMAYIEWIIVFFYNLAIQKPLVSVQYSFSYTLKHKICLVKCWILEIIWPRLTKNSRSFYLISRILNRQFYNQSKRNDITRKHMVSRRKISRKPHRTCA
jgi:hypothetical protein